MINVVPTTEEFPEAVSKEVCKLKNLNDSRTPFVQINSIAIIQVLLQATV